MGFTSLIHYSDMLLNTEMTAVYAEHPLKLKLHVISILLESKPGAAERENNSSPGERTNPQLP